METIGIGERLRQAILAAGYKNPRDFVERNGLESRGLKYKSLTANISANKTPRPPTMMLIASTLGVDPAIFHLADDSDFFAAIEGRASRDVIDDAQGRTGMVRSYRIENTLEAGNVVRGPLPTIGATGSTAALGKALKYSHLHRSGPKEARLVELAGVGLDNEIVELTVPLEVRVSGQTVLHLPAGWLLVVAPGAEPQDGEVELVVVEKALSDTEPGMSELRRFERGPRGVRLLFELGSDRAVTEEQGWRIVGPVVDKRPPPRK